jgi:hypothetical protein
MQMDFDLGGNAMDFNFEFNVGDVGAQRGATTPTSANRKPGTPGSKRVRCPPRCTRIFLLNRRNRKGQIRVREIGVVPKPTC